MKVDSSVDFPAFAASYSDGIGDAIGYFKYAKRGPPVEKTLGNRQSVGCAKKRLKIKEGGAAKRIIARSWSGPAVVPPSWQPWYSQLPYRAEASHY